VFERIKTRVEHMFGTGVRKPYAVFTPGSTSEGTDNASGTPPDTASTTRLTCRNEES